MKPTILIICLLASVLSGCHIGAEETGLTIRLGREATESFEWSGRIAEGGRLEIKNVRGSVTVGAGAGDVVVVSATRRGLRSDPDAVRVEVVEHQAGITVCAVYPGDRNRCAPGDAGRLGAEENDVTVELEVTVPDGVGVTAGTVSGSIDVTVVGGDVDAQTTNGDITISTSGYARARTVNGSIQATLGAANWPGETSFETVNGRIALEIPRDASTEIEARTSNGRITNELPITVSRSSRGRLEGTLGAGGRSLTASTVNGSVRLAPPVD